MEYLLGTIQKQMYGKLMNIKRNEEVGVMYS